MSSAAPGHHAPDAPPAKRRLRPSQIALAIGAVLAGITVISGIAGAIEQWHDKSDRTRRVFVNVPSALQVAFYTLLPMLFLAGGWLFSQRVQNWERGAPDDRSTTPKNAKRRLGDFRSGVYMQTLMRDPAAGIMHSLIYFGFIFLFAVTTVLVVLGSIKPT